MRAFAQFVCKEGHRFDQLGTMRYRLAGSVRQGAHYLGRYRLTQRNASFGMAKTQRPTELDGNAAIYADIYEIWGNVLR